MRHVQTVAALVHRDLGQTAAEAEVLEEVFAETAAPQATSPRGGDLVVRHFPPLASEMKVDVVVQMQMLQLDDASLVALDLVNFILT